mmetsp:Transcript_42177/g.83013  ORF Transcript_42177/g.83013 Transcript_42177/m.83013 type:complete len:441 (+) Transcript_42177:104-1426(+)|eukprot:CAMPEP_0171606172 /NCGR_PEP_ID=MMETSP0990-20121206/7612_1 /TAXON_ID=483369 /ORGANISM="non described non described, Strain CCMP2098" /LENGTH=440 /DNA_ID=CAMNT_0012168973 /DNA_START=7 /DNA_END=1329 /DNA_ORIENTATION=-
MTRGAVLFVSLLSSCQSFKTPVLSKRTWSASYRRSELSVSNPGKQGEGPFGAFRMDDMRTKAASLIAGLALAGTLLATPNAAYGADGAAIGKCLLKSCQVELARCVTNPACLANLACIQTCNGRPDESACQIKCGDTFDNEVIGKFNDCAVSQKKCVPQRADDNTWPVPPEGSVVTKFDTNSFEGRWYISAGLNQIFDTFPCQVHFFEAPKPGLLYAKLNWRVVEPDGEFLQRNAVQRFIQDKEQQGVLFNHDNEYLHYQDDWYILDSETSGKNKGGDDFILVYYRGRNDAWDGYGGAVLYTRTPDTPAGIVPRLEAASEKAGIKFGDFVRNDNSCKEQADAAEKLKLREAYARKELLLGEQQVQERLTTERQLISNTLVAEEKALSKGSASALQRLEQNIATYEAELAQSFQKAEKGIENEVLEIENEFFGVPSTGAKK